MAITLHFINWNYNLIHFLLAFEELPVPHDGENIAAACMEAFKRFGIQNSMSGGVFDNASNNANAVSILLRSNIIKMEELLHNRCSCHILNLIVQEGLSLLKDELQTLRSLCGQIRTPKQMDTFLHFVKKQFGDETPTHKYSPFPAKDCLTRWNSTYNMIKTSLPYRTVLNKVCDATQPINEDEWCVMSAMKDILEPFEETTLTLSAVEKVTLHEVYPEVMGIMSHINQQFEKCEETETNSDLHHCVAGMSEKFNKYWLNVPEAALVANVLDPTMKLEYLNMKNSADARKAETTLKDWYVRYYMPLSDAQAESSTTSIASNNKRKKHAELAKAIYSPVRHSEVHIYLDEPLESDLTEPLDYWKRNQYRFPALAQMARDILAIPASSVPSESVFSQSGRVLDDYRSNLHPSTVAALMLSESWMDAFEKYHWKRPNIKISMRQKEVEEIVINDE